MKKITNYLKNMFLFFGLNSFKIIFRDFIFKCEEYFKNGKMKLIKVYDFEMLIPLGIEGIGRALHVYGGRELDHKWILEKVLKKGDVIFDLGANIGYYALLENDILNGNCKIFAVEPDPRNIKVLEENINKFGLSDNIKFEQIAISNFTGNADLIFSERTNLNRLKFNNDTDNTSELIKVPVVDFCEYLSRLPKIDLMRMDIEGAETDIFDSLIINQDLHNLALPKRIVFETHDYANSKSKMHEKLTKLFDLGYEVEFLASDDEHKPNPAFHQLGYKPFLIMNEVDCKRGLYNNISKKDSISLISNWKGTRTVCLFKGD